MMVSGHFSKTRANGRAIKSIIKIPIAVPGIGFGSPPYNVEFIVRRERAPCAYLNHSLIKYLITSWLRERPQQERLEPIKQNQVELPAVPYVFRAVRRLSNKPTCNIRRAASNARSTNPHLIVLEIVVGIFPPASSEMTSDPIWI